MRRIPLNVLLLLMSLSAMSQQFTSQWQWLNPKPSGFTNNKVRFTDSNHGFIFNEMGELISTADGGDHWRIQQSFPGMKAMDIRDSTGIIGGFSGSLYISTDNGNTWQSRPVGSGQIPYFSFVQVASKDTLLAIDNNGSTLYRSTNRGASWTIVLSNVLLNNNKSFQFINSRVGFIGSYGNIKKTSDGGVTWQTIYSGASWGILAINFLNESVGLAFTEDEKVLRTVDGGLTWTSADLYYEVYDCYFVDANTVYASGGQAKIYKSINGGINWNIISPLSANGGYWYNSVCFVNNNKGFVVGTSGKIMSTTDAGATWNQYGVTHYNITSLYFPSSQVGYATDWGNIYKSTDAGLNWQPTASIVLGTYSSLTHSWFRNKDTGFVISANPVWFFKTKDGGQSWQMFNPLGAGYDHVIDVNFVNDSVGYLCMSNSGSSEFYKTKDAGETWSYIGFTYNAFQRVDFVTAKTGFATSYHGVFKTVDSAKTWQLVYDNTNSIGDLNGVHFINQALGFCYGDNGIMRKTIDSGATWTVVSPPFGHITNLYFHNERVGYMVNETYNQGLLKTYDGGKTWHPDFLMTALHATSTSDTIAYMAGYGGAIIGQAIGGYRVDSLSMNNISSCSANFLAYVSVAFGRVDSMRLEYGTSGFTNIIALAPSSVIDSTVKLAITLQNLQQATDYSYRLRIYYKGNFIYSDVNSFRTLTLPKPSIIAIGDSLISSAYFNNQWYLNGQPISGATNRSYKATVSGTYTVQVNELGCLSQPSDPINLVVTAIDPVLATEISLSPNPTSDILYIKNPRGRRLKLVVADLYGREIYTTMSSSSLVSLPFKKLSAGLYLVTINETGKKNFITRKVVKE